MQKSVDSIAFADLPTRRRRRSSLIATAIALFRSRADALNSVRPYPSLRTPGARPLLPPAFIDELRGRS